MGTCPKQRDREVVFRRGPREFLPDNAVIVRLISWVLEAAMLVPESGEEPARHLRQAAFDMAGDHVRLSHHEMLGGDRLPKPESN